MNSPIPSPLADLSVVVVALGGGRHLARCLDALRRQTATQAMEVVVPHDDQLQDANALCERFPEIRFLHLSGRQTYAGLRAAGVCTSRGKIVAIIEDQCIPPDNWCANVVAAHSESHAAIGGPVEKQQPDTPLNWAIYLRELGTYMPPVREGQSACLTDCNVSYKRAALEAIADVWATEFHEPQVHAALRARGGTLWLSPALLTYQQRSMELLPALKERCEFGRLFASLRVSVIPARKRLLLILGSPFLPTLLLARVLRGVLGKRRHVRACLAALPYLVLFAAAWSFGEFLGYLTGRATR